MLRSNMFSVVFWSFLLISFLLLFSSCWPFILLFWERASTLSSSPYIAVLFLPSSYLSFLSVFYLVFFFITSCFCFMKAIILKTISLCGCSVTKSCPTLCNPMDCSMPASLSFTVSQSLLRLMSTESVMPSNLLIFYCPLILFSIFPSIRVFSKESTGKGGQSIGACLRWPKYLEHQLQHQSFQRIFRVDFL